MNFVKKLIQALVFGFGIAGLFAVLSFFFEWLGVYELVPGWLFLGAFLLGFVVGLVLYSLYTRKKGATHVALFWVACFSFTTFFVLFGAVVGMTLGGNGLVVLEWGGLQGYESVGLIGSLLGSLLGSYFSYRVLEKKNHSLSGIETSLMAVLGCLLALLLSSQNAELVGPPLLFFPLIFIFGWDLLKLHSRRRGGR